MDKIANMKRIAEGYATIHAIKVAADKKERQVEPDKYWRDLHTVALTFCGKAITFIRYADCLARLWQDAIFGEAMQKEYSHHVLNSGSVYLVVDLIWWTDSTPVEARERTDFIEADSKFDAGEWSQRPEERLDASAETLSQLEQMLETARALLERGLK